MEKIKPKQTIEVLKQMKKETKIALWGITRRIENILKRNEKPLDDDYAFQKREEEKLQAIDHAINCVGAIEQIKWERDIAIQQLNELGYQFGEKIRSEEE